MICAVKDRKVKIFKAISQFIHLLLQSRRSIILTKECTLRIQGEESQ
jgi:hypothetical protein